MLSVAESGLWGARLSDAIQAPHREAMQYLNYLAARDCCEAHDYNTDNDG